MNSEQKAIVRPWIRVLLVLAAIFLVTGFDPVGAVIGTRASWILIDVILLSLIVYAIWESRRGAGPRNPSP